MIFQNQKCISKEQTRLFVNIILNNIIVNRNIVSQYHSQPIRDNHIERLMIREICNLIFYMEICDLCH